MRKLFYMATMCCLVTFSVQAQELFPFTEPASNMPTKSIGIRLANEGNFPINATRSVAEVMLGFTKSLMAHGQVFFSDFDGSYRLEGSSIYMKYRFLSLDDVQKHFRMAAYARWSTSNRPFYNEDINLEGDNSGLQSGIVATQLLHKLALSANLSYLHAFKNNTGFNGAVQPGDMLSYSLSSGYLVLPVVYRNYKQPNFNLYLEVLGKTALKTGHSYVDLAPAIQMILNSRTRIDLGYRFEVAGGINSRYNKNMYLVKAEFNFFNVLN